MAQTGFTPISNYYSATASNVPTAGNLVAGELAINTADGKLFYKDSSGVVQTIATKATAALPTTTTGSGSIVLATSPTVTNPALGGSTSGSVTLAVPAVAGSNTATLPAATGTVMVSGNMPAFNAYKSGSSYTTFSSATLTKVALDAELFDTANCFDSVTNNRFTPTVAGYYQINASIETNYTGTQFTYYQVIIYKNGTGSSANIVSYATTNTGATQVYGTLNPSNLIYFNGTTDYVELYVYAVVASGNPAYNQGNYRSYMSGSLVRSA
jgi:hypothetical protein